MPRNYKCVLSGKICPFSKADFLYDYGERCPIERYKTSDYTCAEQVITDKECRYHGVLRYQGIKGINFVDGGPEEVIPYGPDK